jgi:adenine-specific DNA-methyltransferase
MTYRCPPARRIHKVMEEITGWGRGTAPVEVLRGGKAVVAQMAEKVAPRRRSAFAAAFAVAALRRYWSEIQSEHEAAWPLPPPLAAPARPQAVDAAAGWVATALGRAAARVDPVTAGYFIGTTYAAALPPDVRARFGVYYTPPALAARLLDQASAAGLDWATCTVLDPACGGGAFLAPVAQRMAKHLSHLEPEVLVDSIARRVRGFEIDPVAAWMSQVFLEATILPACRAARRRLPQVVEVRDSLQRPDDDGAYDLVIGNPPYGRVTLAPAMRARYAASLYGHANLYGIFTELALLRARPGGLVAYVTPTSFLAGEYFKNLRSLLGRRAPPQAVDFIARRKGVFDEVLQEALLATYRRDAPPGEAPVHFLTPVDESAIRVDAAGTFTLPSEPGAPWLVPRTLAQSALIRTMRRMSDRLADWGYTVSTGPLVWNRHRDQLCGDAGPGRLPVVWAEAVTPDGRFVLRATKANHRPYFEPGSSDAGLIATSSCVLVQRTTAKEQARRIIATVLPAEIVRRHGGAVVENHLNMVRPVKGPPAVAPEVLAAFLNSAIVDQAFRCLSGSVAVSAYELEALPLPPPTALRELDEALAARAGRPEIDRVCARMYGAR